MGDITVLITSPNIVAAVTHPVIAVEIQGGAKGAPGEPGTPGSPGQDGEDGAPGVGVPAGGATGQVLRKASNIDYDTEWSAGGGGGGTWGSIVGTLSDQTDLQTALDNRVVKNAAISSRTKTKITYDSKGLVTAGGDATTADIADSTDRRYVTDGVLAIVGTFEELGGYTLLGNTSDLSGPVVQMSIAEALEFAGSVVGSILYRSATGWDVLLPGNAGQLLASGGPGADLYYQNAVSLPGGTSTQTLRYNSSNALVPTSILRNDGATIAINTSPIPNRILLIQHANDSNGLEIRRSGGSGGLHIYNNPHATIQSTVWNLEFKSAGTMSFYGPGGGGYINQVQFLTQTNITSNFGNSSMFNFNPTYAPTTAGGDFAFLKFQATVNQTGSANQDVFALDFVPTLTSLTGNFHGVRYMPYGGRFLWQPNAEAAVVSHHAGNMGIGPGTTAPGAKLHVAGSGTSTGYAFLVTDSAAAGRFFVRDNGNASFANTVCIGSSAESNGSAALEISSTTRGVLLPRMTTTQRDAISSPADGLLIYNSTNSKFQGRAGGAWVDLN